MTHFKDNVAQAWQRLDESWRFALTAFLIARVSYLLWSWVIFTAQPVAIQNFELSGESILSVFRLQDSEVRVYLRDVKGEILSFQSIDAEHLIDQQSGSIWDLETGTAIQGQFKGTTLLAATTKPEHIFPYRGVKPYGGVWLAMWQRFDANWYAAVAERGYGTIPGDDHFPPLFPLLLRILQPIFGSTFIAGLFVSQAATLITLKLLYEVFQQWGTKAVGKRALLFFILYPAFFFFFSVYSEPVFLVLSLLAIHEMNRHRWAWAGFWVFCAILTRLQGAALLIPMLYLIWKDRQWKIPSVWFGLTVSGAGGLFYLYLRSLQVRQAAVPFVEPEWHARLVPPWETYWYALRTAFGGNASFVDILNWSVMTLFIVLLIWGWKIIPLEYNLYTAFSILIILIRIVETQPLISMSRYATTLFPGFYALSVIGEHPVLRRIILYGFIPLHLYLCGQFLLWGWVA
jgi:hypothetical protein